MRRLHPRRRMASLDRGSHPGSLACHPGMRSTTAAAAVLAALALAHPRPAAAEEGVDARPKSGAVATGLAIGGTLGGFALAAAAGDQESEALGWVALGVVTIGPAAGHFYAGEIGHGVTTSAIRAGAAAAFVTGFNMSFCLFECADRSVDQRRVGTVLAWAGVGIYTASIIYDVVDAHQAADRANRQYATAAAPAMLTTPDGGHAPGMVLAGSF